MPIQWYKLTTSMSSTCTKLVWDLPRVTVKKGGDGAGTSAKTRHEDEIKST